MERRPDNNNIPQGYIFRPTDRMLIGFLALFVAGKPVISTVPIAQINLYDGLEPWQVFKDSKEKILYFFTPLKKKNNNHSRYSRTIGEGKENGTWKAQDRGKPIYGYKEEEEVDDNKPSILLMGYKRSLRYEKRGSKYDGRFLMKEYYLPSTIRATLEEPLKDIVVCRIKRKQERDITVSESESIEARHIGDIIGDVTKSPT